MPDRSTDPQQQQRPEDAVDDLVRRLRELRMRGEAGRREIVERLAAMPLDQLRRVPGWVIARLGPRGMALLAERSRVIRVQSSGSPAPKAAPPARAARIVPEPTPSWFTRLRRRRPLWWECLTKAVVASTIGWLVVVAFPVAERVVPELMAQPLLPHVCSRLDAWTGDCGYILGSTGLSLSMAAEKLALPLAVLAAANRSFAPDVSLPRGTRINVPHRSGINLR